MRKGVGFRILEEGMYKSHSTNIKNGTPVKKRLRYLTAVGILRIRSLAWSGVLSYKRKRGRVWGPSGLGVGVGIWGRGSYGKGGGGNIYIYIYI